MRRTWGDRPPRPNESETKASLPARAGWRNADGGSGLPETCLPPACAYCWNADESGWEAATFCDDRFSAKKNMLTAKLTESRIRSIVCPPHLERADQGVTEGKTTMTMGEILQIALGSVVCVLSSLANYQQLLSARREQDTMAELRSSLLINGSVILAFIYIIVAFVGNDRSARFVHVVAIGGLVLFCTAFLVMAYEHLSTRNKRKHKIS